MNENLPVKTLKRSTKIGKREVCQLACAACIQSFWNTQTNSAIANNFYRVLLKNLFTHFVVKCVGFSFEQKSPILSCKSLCVCTLCQHWRFEGNFSTSLWIALSKVESITIPCLHSCKVSKQKWLFLRSCWRDIIVKLDSQNVCCSFEEEFSNKKLARACTLYTFGAAFTTTPP